ncbi:MAG: hypothetical protein FWD75_00705 [Propionibacteriaceae bacterium]|nr:hypothetical protein [Propionibacteriaceae bacterium]
MTTTTENAQAIQEPTVAMAGQAAKPMNADGSILVAGVLAFGALVLFIVGLVGTDVSDGVGLFRTHSRVIRLAPIYSGIGTLLAAILLVLGRIMTIQVRLFNELLKRADS